MLASDERKEYKKGQAKSKYKMTKKEVIVKIKSNVNQ